MAEYIEREAAIKLFNFAVLDCLGMEPTIRAWDIIKAIESIPAADVRPVVRARWKPVMCAGNPSIQDRDELYGLLFVCDKCNWTMIGESNFCPNCGASMGETNDEKA